MTDIKQICYYGPSTDSSFSHPACVPSRRRTPGGSQVNVSLWCNKLEINKTSLSEKRSVVMLCQFLSTNQLWAPVRLEYLPLLFLLLKHLGFSLYSKNYSLLDCSKISQSVCMKVKQSSHWQFLYWFSMSATEMISQLALVLNSDLLCKICSNSQAITEKQPLSTFDRQQILQMANSSMEHDQPPKVNVQNSTH